MASVRSSEVETTLLPRGATFLKSYVATGLWKRGIKARYKLFLCGL